MRNIDTNNKMTITGIADALGCSTTTVSRAISGKGRISQKKRKEVLEYCRQYGYRINTVEDSLGKIRTCQLAVILPDNQEMCQIPFFQRCLAGICEAASNHNYNILVIMTEPGETWKVERMIEGGGAEGIIVTRTSVRDPLTDYLVRSGVPFVLIGGGASSEVCVDEDTVSACMEMTKRLLEAHLYRIALIGENEEHTVTQKRLTGFLEGFHAYHREADEKLIYLNCGTKDKVFGAVEKIVEQCAECIVCMDDKICSQVLMKLRQMHLSVPKDVKVASFYDSTFLENHVPPITALAFDERELGRQACERLIHKLERGADGEKIVADYKVIMRASTQKR